MGDDRLKIERYQKNRQGDYSIFLDDGREYHFYEEIILQYELLLKRDISPALLQQAQQENRTWESYYAALKLLRRIAKSKAEVVSYLHSKGYTSQDCQQAILQLVQQGYLNDQRYANSFVHQQLLTTTKGPLRIQQELEKKQIAEEDYRDALLMYTKTLEREKIAKIIMKAQKTNHHKSTFTLRKKLESQLLLAGFSRDCVQEALKDFKVVDEEALARREYEKLYAKLSKKYSAQELSYKIKQQMYSKGFTVPSDLSI